MMVWTIFRIKFWSVIDAFKSSWSMNSVPLHMIMYWRVDDDLSILMSFSLVGSEQKSKRGERRLLSMSHLKIQSIVCSCCSHFQHHIFAFIETTICHFSLRNSRNDESRDVSSLSSASSNRMRHRSAQCSSICAVYEIIGVCRWWISNSQLYTVLSLLLRHNSFRQVMSTIVKAFRHLCDV